MATFWLIRKSALWKRIRFTTPLNKLKIETFDAVTLSFKQPYVATGPVLAIVESAKYDSLNNCIHFQCLTPVTAGTSAEYHWFWPADLPKSDTWPPKTEIEDGYAGTGGPGSGASGPLPVGDTSTIGQTVFVGGTNVVFGPHSDYGDSTPTDQGFTAQSTVLSDDYAISSTQRSTLDLTVDYAEKAPPLTYVVTDEVAAAAAKNPPIDLTKTVVTDGENQTTFAKVFKIIDGQLCLDVGVPFVEEVNAAPFDFQYDPEGDVFGAGTAFLKDE